VINAKEEILKEIGTKQVKCIRLTNGDPTWNDDIGVASLPVGHTQEQYEQFINMLDVEYDDGYGRQNLYGTIWYTDGTWSERGEYDGSEWWEYKSCPEIPEDMQQLQLGFEI
jgi:hypothetical protein